MPAVSFSPVAQNYYLDVLSEAVLQWYTAAHAYSPATAGCLSRLALLSLLGYFSFLLLVLFTHGAIPEVIKRGAMKGRNITPTFVFSTCALAIGALALLLAPLEHALPALPQGAAQLLAPLYAALGAFKLPSPDVEGLLQALGLVAGLHCASFALYAALPARSVEGYVLTERGSVAVYRLPGFNLLLVGAGAWGAGVAGGLLPATHLWEHGWEVVGASCAAGLLVSAAFFFRGSRLRGWANEGLDVRARCPSRDMAHLLGKCPLPKADKGEAQEFFERDPLDHFYCGLSEFNPVWLGVDWKMWLYATGALVLQLNVLSAMAANGAARSSEGLEGYGNATMGIAACLSFFVAEYMWNEMPHLWTYDIFRERLGFKLIWGCLCWYPNFYFIPLAAAVQAPLGSDVSPATAGACVLLFLLGWAFTRGANMQKFYCKTSPAPPRGKDLPPFLGLFSMATVPGTAGRVLCGGFWGLSRHVNYAGEIMQALALAVLAVLAGGSLKALLYPLYYFAIFLPRQVDDDVICEAKYGKKVWGEYCARVPYRIFPGIY